MMWEIIHNAARNGLTTCFVGRDNADAQRIAYAAGAPPSLFVIGAGTAIGGRGFDVIAVDWGALDLVDEGLLRCRLNPNGIYLLGRAE